MIKIFIPYLDQPRKFSFPFARSPQFHFALERRIRASFRVGNWTYVGLERVVNGSQTLGELDPLTLGDMAFLTFGGILCSSANWHILHNADVSLLTSPAVVNPSLDSNAQVDENKTDLLSSASPRNEI